MRKPRAIIHGETIHHVYFCGKDDFLALGGGKAGRDLTQGEIWL
jgi:hypothetical protein